MGGPGKEASRFRRGEYVTTSSVDAAVDVDACVPQSPSTFCNTLHFWRSKENCVRDDNVTQVQLDDLAKSIDEVSAASREQTDAVAKTAEHAEELVEEARSLQKTIQRQLNRWPGRPDDIDTTSFADAVVDVDVDVCVPLSPNTFCGITPEVKRVQSKEKCVRFQRGDSVTSSFQDAVVVNDDVDTDDLNCQSLGEDGWRRQATARVYGGNFAVVGRSYKIRLAIGLSPLQLLNKLSKNLLKLRFVVFCEDGTLSRPGETTPAFPMGNIDLRWRFDQSSGRFIIDFFRDDELLDWRWDELRPTAHPVVGDVEEMDCIGHVAARTFQYALIADNSSGSPSKSSPQNKSPLGAKGSTADNSPTFTLPRLCSQFSMQFSTHEAALQAATIGSEAVANLKDGYSFFKVEDYYHDDNVIRSLAFEPHVGA